VATEVTDKPGAPLDGAAAANFWAGAEPGGVPGASSLMIQ